MPARNPNTVMSPFLMNPHKDGALRGKNIPKHKIKWTMKILWCSGKKKGLLRNKKALLENKRAIPGHKKALLGNKRVILENQRTILGT